MCLCWGELPQFADCAACSPWRLKYRDRAACRRCGHDSHVNTDGLCRLCLQIIRTDDPGWINEPVSGRPSQLRFILPGLRLPRAQPLDRPIRGRPRQDRPRSWLEHLRVTAAAAPVDDPRVCPPAVRGQLTLFAMARTLTVAQARRIRHRELRDYQRVRSAVIAFADEQRLSTAWWRAVDLRLRLALAVREADGGDLVAEESLDDLPGFHDAAAEVLRRTGLLRPRSHARPVVVTRPPRNCAHCGSWGLRTICSQCIQWRRHPVGECSRCRRANLPLLEGRCRSCCVHLEHHHGPEAMGGPHVQLWLGGPFALVLRGRTRFSTDDEPPRHRARQRPADRRPPRQPVSSQLVDPAQGVLVEVRREWGFVTVGSLEYLPSLTPAAKVLLEAFRQHGRDQHWHAEVARLATRSLRILLAWLGADAPIPEADVRALPSDRPGTSARRVVQFLAEHELLVADPSRQVDPHERAVTERVGTFPAGIGDEVGRWVLVLRGEGRREHPVRSFETIRKYLSYMSPALHSWAEGRSSLREVTPDDVRQALGGLKGNTARSAFSGLCSLFRALKQERVIFRDPTRGITLPAARLLPVPISSDRLEGLISRAGGPMARFVVALVAIHALGPSEITRLFLDDLDLARGRLSVGRSTGRHTVYVDELTHSLAATWLRERHRRWPTSANPHLLVSQQTAVMDKDPPVAREVIYLVFRPLGLSPSKLRQDRILDEARHTADPVHLMRVFGIADRTAMHYVSTAHPERRSTLPR